MTYLKMELSVKDDDDDNNNNDNALLVHITQSMFRKKGTGIHFSSTNPLRILTDFVLLGYLF
jgi:hypothetical protein